jgi:SAM-dependent methyltransferase
VTASFYDELAPFYHLIYENWEGAVSRQGAGIAAVLRALGVQPGASVLDAASGIGTQAIGLVTQGYRVAASDISPGAIARLKAELSLRGLRAEASVDDIRTLAHVDTQSFAAVIACDNSIPHLLSDSEILNAFRSCLRCLLPGGVAIFSVRDYAIIERKSPDVRPYGLRYAAGNRFLAVQVWEWDEDQYDLRMYLTSESPSGICDTRVLRTRYYAVSISRLLELMGEAGFVDVQRRDDVLFQPALMGRRPNAA